MATAAMDILSVEEILEGPRAINIQKWQQQSLKYGEEVAARSLVIAVSAVTPTRLLLDPETVNKDGEWKCILYHPDDAIKYPSFLAWLEKTVDEFREMLKDEKR